jgi:hypothetical protein
MDDQRTNRAGGGRVRRFQFSVRMMLLITALLAVTCAWVVTKRQAWRAQLKAEIRQIEMMRNTPTDNDVQRQRMLAEINAEVAKRRELLGEED